MKKRYQPRRVPQGWMIPGVLSFIVPSILAAVEFEVSDQIIEFVVVTLVEALFLFFAAKFVLDRSSLLAALGTALLGAFLATIVVTLLASLVDLPEWALIVINVVIWSAVAAFFFRAKLVQGAIIGVVAWLLWLLVNFLLGLAGF